MGNGSYLEGTIVLLEQLFQNDPLKTIETGRIGVFLLWLKRDGKRGNAEARKHSKGCKPFSDKVLR